MATNSPDWMEYVVRLADQNDLSDRKVGAALVSASNELLCSAFEGEQPGQAWEDALLLRVASSDASAAPALYLTVNTLTDTGQFGLSKLSASVEIRDIFIGLPDPALASYLEHDPVLVREEVRRFPDALQRRILVQNAKAYAASQQSISFNPHYSKHRIGEAVLSALNVEGLPLTAEEFHANRTRRTLATLVGGKHGLTPQRAEEIVARALSNAFDAKYGSYDYSDDARSVNPDWPEQFRSVYQTLNLGSMSALNVLNVGVGAGLEASKLFGESSQATFVDIAESSVANIRRRFPKAHALVANADELRALPEHQYDLYVSLRTYNSSFFDIRSAAAEARRVLKVGGGLIVSVANGFLHGGRADSVMPGLILPGTEFVDLYRSVDVARALAAEFEKAGFANMQMSPTVTEIYLSGIAA